MITLTTGIFFPYSLACALECGGPRVRRLPVEWSAIAESLRNTALE
jgi:hypothetical protein